MEMAFGIAVGLAIMAAIFAILGVIDRVMPHRWDFSLGSDGIEYRFFGRRCIRYDAIEDVEVMSTLDVLFDPTLGGFGTIQISNRIFSWHVVVVRRNGGGAFVLTPAAPQAFAAQLQERLRAAGSQPGPSMAARPN